MLYGKHKFSEATKIYKICFSKLTLPNSTCNFALGWITQWHALPHFVWVHSTTIIFNKEHSCFVFIILQHINVHIGSSIYDFIKRVIQQLSQCPQSPLVACCIWVQKFRMYTNMIQSGYWKEKVNVKLEYRKKITDTCVSNPDRLRKKYYTHTDFHKEHVCWQIRCMSEKENFQWKRRKYIFLNLYHFI